MKGKRFDPEFKKDIAKPYLSSERTGTSLAEEFGIHPNTVVQVGGTVQRRPCIPFPDRVGNLKPDEEELRKAHRKIKELEAEIAILKQAAVYFAKNRK